MMLFRDDDGDDKDGDGVQNAECWTDSVIFLSFFYLSTSYTLNG